MFVTPERLDDIGRIASGDLSEVALPWLLRALWQSRRTCTVRFERSRVWKRVAFEDGHPVACDSNLAHERFGRFLVDLGRIEERVFSSCFSEALSRSRPLGEVLMEHGVMEAEELMKLLRQCLAKGLLDLFTWEQGRFVVGGEQLEIPAPLTVHTPQLLLTGCWRFTPQSAVDRAVMALIGQRLVCEPRPTVAFDDLRLSKVQGQLLGRLSAPSSLSDLKASCDLETDLLSRIVYAFAILGLITTEDALAQRSQERPAPRDQATAAGEPEEAAPEEVARRFLAYRRRDAFELLGVAEDATRPEVEDAFVQFARRYAPWRFPRGEVADQARALLLAGAGACADLLDAERRQTLVFRRKLNRERHAKAKEGPARIETDLLDPVVQFRNGRRLLAEGRPRKALAHLELAAECDPQNGLYRAEAAYCHFLVTPSHAPALLRSLKETLRIDPECGLAYLYAGEIALELERWEEAEVLLRQASRLLAPDRRPVEKLKELATRRKRRKR